MNLVPAPAALNFLAGVFAGAGINMLTSVSTGPDGNVRASAIAVDSALWILGAAFLTWGAHIFEEAQREAELHIDRDFSDREKAEIREAQLLEARRRAAVPLLLTGIAISGAILLLPGLFPWG